MDDASSPLDPGSPPSGGAVEPAGRPSAQKVRSPAEALETGERYELRDPFSEVIYNARTLGEMASKAEQLGAHRFVAIDGNGQRSFVEQSNGAWQRQPAMNQEPKPEPSPTVAMSASTEPARSESKASTRTMVAAERAARQEQLQSALNERYIIKRAPATVGDVPLGRTEYRFRGDSSRVAFTESTFRLATDTNSPSVARSMVDVAQARNWSALRVSGHEDFKRMVWLEASVRGVKAIGYEPNVADLEVLRRERDARQVNRIEAAAGAGVAASDKPSGRGGGGRKAVLAAIEAVLVARGVSHAHREAVMTAAADKLVLRERVGRSTTVKLYDKAAPTQRSTAVPNRELEQTRIEQRR